MNNASPHPDLTLMGVTRDPSGGFRIVLPHGKEYVCRTAAELWADMGDIAGGGVKALPGAPGESRRTHHRVRATPVKDAEEAGALDVGGIENAMGQAGDVFEEVLAQEWGTLGRLVARNVREHAPGIAKSLSPRNRAKRRGRSL